MTSDAEVSRRCSLARSPWRRRFDPASGDAGGVTDEWRRERR